MNDYRHGFDVPSYTLRPEMAMHMNIPWASLHLLAFSVTVLSDGSCSLPSSYQGACMLQTHVQTPAQREQIMAKHKRQAGFPIEWVHVPKCGTSFINTMIHAPGACPGIPDNWTTEEMSLITQDLFCGDGIDVNRIKHRGVEDVPGWEEGKGRFMIMVRQPEQRALSAWYFYMKERNSHGKDLSATAYDLMTHSYINNGCVVKMLVRQNQRGCEGESVSDKEMAEAKLRLKTGFAFVGLTDQWDLSICLFNRMFGVPHCRPSQFIDSRPTSGNGSSEYNVSGLGGWQDDDNEIYELATQIFAASLVEYDVNDATCQSCWQEAGRHGHRKRH